MSIGSANIRTDLSWDQLGGKSLHHCQNSDSFLKTRYFRQFFPVLSGYLQLELLFMIEAYVQFQKVTSYSSSWRNCWMRVDDKNIHLFYRSNCPPKGVKANKVEIIIPIVTVGN